MRHFDIWQWTDYARGLVAGVDRSPMDAHLFSGCQRCQRTVNVLRGVAAAARGETGPPPEHAIRYAQAICSLHRPEKISFPRWVARLVHDTVREPLPAGMRAEDRLSRHALYEAGSYSLDLQLENQLASGLVTLIGQLADRNKPAISTAAVPVWLMEGERLVTSTLSNRFGEFQLEYAPSCRLRLSLPLPAVRKRLEVPLNRLSPGPRSRPKPAKIVSRRTQPTKRQKI